VEPAGHADHVIPVVPVRQPGPQEDPANVDVIGDVALIEVADRDAEVPLQNLDGHRHLLLSDAHEVVEPLLELVGCRIVGPDRRGVTVVASPS
jgi:hypothetical protein